MHFQHRTYSDGRREAVFNINAKRSRHSGLSVLCMNNDSSLQVGRTWRRGPFANPLWHQHVPWSVCEICLQSLISHSRGRAVNSSEHVILIFITVSLTFRHPFMAFSLPLKKMKMLSSFKVKISGLFLLNHLFTALTLQTVKILFFFFRSLVKLSLAWLHFLIFFLSKMNGSHILHSLCLLLQLSE